MVAHLFYTMFPFFEMVGANKKLIARVKEIESGNNLEHNILSCLSWNWRIPLFVLTFDKRRKSHGQKTKKLYP